MNKTTDDRKPSAVWDELAGAYASSRQVSADQLIEWPAQLRMVGDPAGLDILDVGCGTGEKARYFAETGAKSVVGVDPSAGFSEYWANHAGLEGLTFIRGGFEDMCSLPVLQGRNFDLIVCFQALMYSHNISETVRVLASFLKPGGALASPSLIRFDSPYSRAKGKIGGRDLLISIRNRTAIHPHGSQMSISNTRCHG